MKPPRITPSARTTPLAAQAAAPNLKFISVISAMHARWEEIDQHYNDADCAMSDGSPRAPYLQEAMQDLTRDQDALQAVILRQRPVDDRDLAILTYHLQLATDVLNGSDFSKPLESEQRSLVSVAAAAAELIFDYVANSIGTDALQIGPQFLSGAERCARRRCDREGDFPARPDLAEPLGEAA